ncbi:hypothetical protein BGX24_006356, partial [Mortierella sp. AD032]
GMHRTSSKTRFFVFDQHFVQGFVDAVRYGHPPLANWNTNRLEQALDLQDCMVANPNCDAKAFAVVNTGGHWTVLVFDFRRKQLLFGDSMDKGKLDLNGRQYIVDGAFLLLQSCRSLAGEKGSAAVAMGDKAQRFIRVDEWVKDPARFPVPQQSDSVSCGIAALSAIEHSINPSCELWSQRRATFFRVKYLMYSTTSLRPATFILPKPSQPPLALDKANDNTPQGRAAGEDTTVSINAKHAAQNDKQSDTGPILPNSTVEHGSSTTLSTDTAEETSCPFLEKKAESFIENTATLSIKEDDSKDKNQQSADRKVFKPEIGEQNVKDKSREASHSAMSPSPLSSDPEPEDECFMNEDGDEKNLNPPSSQETAQEYPWMNMVFDTANEARDFFLEWSDGENFVVRLGRSRLERGL